MRVWLRRWRWWHLPLVWAVAVIVAVGCVALDLLLGPDDVYYIIPYGRTLRGTVVMAAAMFRERPLATTGLVGAPLLAVVGTLLWAVEGLRRAVRALRIRRA